MTHFLKTTLAVTLVVFLVSIWVLEAKIAEEVSELLYKNIKLSAIHKTMESASFCSRELTILSSIMRKGKENAYLSSK